MWKISTLFLLLVLIGKGMCLHMEKLCTGQTFILQILPYVPLLVVRGSKSGATCSTEAGSPGGLRC